MRLTKVTVRLLSVIFKEVHSDRKEANIAACLKKDEKEDPGKVMQQIFLETMSEHIKIRKVTGNSQHLVTMGKINLTFRVAFFDGLAGCVDKGRTAEVAYLWLQQSLGLCFP